MSTALATLTNSFAARFGLGDNQKELIDTLKATAFKGGNVTDAQMTALMLVAQQYNLNPWLKEIDGWARIMNDHPQFDGMEFQQDDESCTCIIYRKDRSHATKATEYMNECRRTNTGPWQSHPKRMLRHKAMIQAARLAFGFGGIYDQDEAERIIETIDIDTSTGEIKEKKPEYLSSEIFDAQKSGWEKAITGGKKTAQALIAWVEAKGTKLTESQLKIINTWKVIPPEEKQGSPAIDPDDIPFN